MGVMTTSGLRTSSPQLEIVVHSSENTKPETLTQDGRPTKLGSQIGSSQPRTDVDRFLWENALDQLRPFLKRITYTFIITVLLPGVPDGRISIYLEVPPPSIYKDIRSKAEQSLQNHIRTAFPHEPSDKELLFRNGTAIIDSVGGKSAHELSSQSDWDAICAIAKLLSDSTGSIYIGISHDYVALRNRTEIGKTFAKTKRDEICKMMFKAINNQKYIRRSDIVLIASRDTIRKAVDEDTPPGMNSAGEEDFILSIYNNVRTLFTMCIHAELSMGCSKTLLDRGRNDSTYPFQDDYICHDACEGNYSNMLKWQGSLSAAVFFQKGQHQDLDYGVVVPFHYCPNTKDEESILQEDETTSDKEKARCGTGSFSEVFRITIDQDHHQLATDRTIPFAVKEFRDRPDRRGKDFARELAVLQKLLRHPHPYIVSEFRSAMNTA
ncbi:MAG: hypothetical protein Q9170_003135 [Blastenia crenularia]